MDKKNVLVMSCYPPVKDRATATYSVAWSLAKALEPVTGLLLTRRMHLWVEPDRIATDLQSPVRTFRDASRLGLMGFSEDLRGLLDTFLLALQSPSVIRDAAGRGCQRLFMIGTNHWCALSMSLLVAKLAGIPADIYLMDDLEASARMQGKPLKARVARLVESWLLPRFEQVWTICDGYAEHLRSKYGVPAITLPLVIRQSSAEFRPGPPAGPRIIGYSGGVHGLYEQPLKDLVAEIRRRNSTAGPRHVLRLFVPSAPPGFLDFLGGDDSIEVVAGLDNAGLLAGLGESHANFLPYSFEEKFRLMVSTAFSCKSAEYLACGRPILVYGPAYASVPRHFREAGLPLVEIREEGIAALLDALPEHDSPALIDSYNKLVADFHAPAAVRARLTRHWSPAVEPAAASFPGPSARIETIS
jgi:hypothetical protein